MADFAQVHPLGEHSSHKNAGVWLEARPVTFMAQVFAKKGQTDKLAGKLKVATTPGISSQSKDSVALPISPGQWMLVSHEEQGPSFKELEKQVGKLGHVSQQSDARICIRISGPAARDLMSRGCRLDLHPQSAAPGFCAQTPIAQVSVLLHQIDASPVYDLYVYSGFARSFWHWLTHTAEQFA